ncbi:MAG TPA: polyprenyl synthetase family protein, partial [Candidatus Paceibacterota bacterium]|nr:polyprenyl synthetase family protein [Candidatus Paceibacterota bacterium]
MWTAESRTLPPTQPNASPRGDLAAWGTIVQTVQPFLNDVALQVTDQVQAFDPEIAVYAQYALTNQGKQLRPALVALSAGSVGNVNPDHVNAAAIVEMVHLATLVHDDIMDAAEIRRGRPTVAANWGNEISVLLGDCLFAQS